MPHAPAADRLRGEVRGQEIFVLDSFFGVAGLRKSVYHFGGGLILFLLPNSVDDNHIVAWMHFLHGASSWGVRDSPSTGSATASEFHLLREIAAL